MDLLDRDLSEVQLSVTHKRLDELHPADVADILEQLDPQQRANVFEHLDDAQATEAISEMEDEYQSDFIEELGQQARAANVLGNMDPDDAADIVRDLSYEQRRNAPAPYGRGRRHRDPPPARLQGRHRRRHDDHAVRIRRTMTDTVGRRPSRCCASCRRTILPSTIVYVLNEYDKLVGVLLAAHLGAHRRRERPSSTCMFDDLITATPDETEEDVAADIFKYDLTAMPVVDEHGTPAWASSPSTTRGMPSRTTSAATRTKTSVREVGRHRDWLP